jgi:uncharacterized protein (TIRG00374 family)
MMQTEPQKKLFSWKSLSIPIGITALATAYLVYLLAQTDYSAFSEIKWSGKIAMVLILAFGTVLIRDAAYVYRIWELSDRKLSLWQSIEVIFLWEFGSSVTPASFGGVSLAFFILFKEGIKPGKATSILMFCSYLDNIAFIISFSCLFFLFGNQMFDLSASCGSFGDLQTVKAFRTVGEYVWIGFLAVAFSGSLLGFAIFIKPHYASTFLISVSRIKFLHKWQTQIHHIGEDLYRTSLEFRSKGMWFITRVLVATIISWSARYALANTLIYGFASDDFSQLMIFARQYVHRVIVMIPATPGGSGIAELSFMALNCDFIKEGLAPFVTLLWRGFNFYFYLLIGILILPKWLSRVSKKA